MSSFLLPTDADVPFWVCGNQEGLGAFIFGLKGLQGRQLSIRAVLFSLGAQIQTAQHSATEQSQLKAVTIK